MAFKARVYLQRLGESSATYIGELDLESRPVRNGRATFTHAGKVETGHIDTVSPPDWDKTGAIPTIRVVQS
jgi:hypothetical protein